MVLIYARSRGCSEADVMKERGPQSQGRPQSNSALGDGTAGGCMASVRSRSAARPDCTKIRKYSPPLNQHFPLLRWKHRAPLGHT